MSTKEQIVQELRSFSETELKQVAEFMAFLKFRARLKPIPTFNEAQLGVC